jgi:hypothetical protein
MLDRLRLAVRPRSPWAAADLGLALLRAEAGPVYRVWLAILLPAALVLALLCRDHPWLAPLILWWLKPALDRPVLHVLATATFGEAPHWSRTLRSGSAFRRGLAATLLWRRFSPERSLLLPVWQLEQASGAEFRRRRKVLLLRGRSQAQLLTGVCLLFMAVLALAALAGLAYAWPGTRGLGILAPVLGGHRPPWLDPLLALLPTLAMAAVEPCYVAAGFGLYLNRRVQLEGWDLELAFRQLAERARKAAPGPRAGGLLLAALLVFAPLGLRAQPPGQEPTGPKAALAEVLKAPEFSGQRTVWRLRPRHSPAPSAPAPALPAWVARALDLLAGALKWLLPAAAAVALLLALWKHRGGLAWAGREAAGQLPAPFPGERRPGGLPRDLPGAARRLLDQGDPRGALALLYRGALAHLADLPPADGPRSPHLPLSAAATEAECLARAGGLPEPAFRYFAELTAAWQETAYGGREAPARTRDLCAAWAGHFPAPAGRP